MNNEERILEILNSLKTDIDGLKNTQVKLIDEVNAIHKQTEKINANTDSKSGLYQQVLL